MGGSLYPESDLSPDQQEHGRGSGAGFWGNSQRGNAARGRQLQAQGQSQEQQHPLGSHLLPGVTPHPGRTHHLPARWPAQSPRRGLCVPGKQDFELPWGISGPSVGICKLMQPWTELPNPSPSFSSRLQTYKGNADCEGGEAQCDVCSQYFQGMNCPFLCLYGNQTTYL